MRRVLLPGLACSLSLVLLGGCSSTPPSTQLVPRFERGACAHKLGQGLVDGQNIQCGFLIVRQDRANANSPTIKLAVAILKPSGAATASDPVIYLSGGPGESPLTDFAPLFTPDGVGYYFGNRDLIIFDPRGVGGYSQPSLDCPELRASTYGALDQNLTPDQYDAVYRKAMQQCHTRLIEAGINLSLFTTYTSAADVHDLIQALGYQQVNLYGGSYGTRLALEVMREFPQRVRSVVLDSTLPPQTDLFTSVPASAMRAFDTLFSACAASATCNRSYPQLQSTFYALADTLNEHPLTLHDVVDPFTNQSYTVLLNGWRFVELFFLSLYDTTMLPQLPADIYAARSDNTAPLTALYHAEMFTEDAISRGMWYSVECNDDAPFGTSQDVEMAEQTFAPPIRAADLFNLQTRLGICQFWNVQAAATAEKQPVVSAIPTLILEGEYDPITPPANGNLAARTLSHSDALLFPGTGHGVNFGPSACPKDIVLAFLATPTQPPDSSCIASMSEPAFT